MSNSGKSYFNFYERKKDLFLFLKVMKLEDYIDPIYFLLAFTFGLFIVLSLEPQKNVIVKYPTQFNLDDVYKDESGTCWKYKSEETECDGTEIETPLNQKAIFK